MNKFALKLKKYKKNSPTCGKSARIFHSNAPYLQEGDDVAVGTMTETLMNEVTWGANNSKMIGTWQILTGGEEMDTIFVSFCKC